MATQTKKFKKVRLFKVSKELNIAVDTLVEHLKASGFKDALTGKGVNASITDEEAYYELLEEFAADKATAARVKEKRARRMAELESERQALAQEATEPVQEEPEAEETPAPVEVEAPAEAAEVVAEGAAAPEPVAETPEPVAEEVAAPEAVAEVEEASEPVAEEAETPEPVAEEAAAPGPEVEETPVSVAGTAETPETSEPVAETSEPVAETGAAVSETGELVAGTSEDKQPEDESVIGADRYKLAGTKILGKIDLDTVEHSEPKRKRRRKRKTTAKPTDGAAEPVSAKSAAKEKETSRKKKSRKRGPHVDEADVEQTLQDTLRELEQGASRVRQRRRRQRRDERAAVRQRQMEAQEATEKVLRVTEFVSTGELANLMDVPVNEVIGTLFNLGMIVSINQRLDADTISIVAEEYGYDVEFITDLGIEDILIEEDRPEDLEPRAPVVTVMGHVDHGKTSLLDYVRSENIVAGEAGGITQHIGAYHVELSNGKEITFLDTPGHEAFTAMRARGAQVTDVVILVVAADDAVMPQTIEAINHARAAEVPIVVAINKIDKPNANPQRVMQQLADEGVLVEQYGGKVQCALVSAKTGEGVQDLLDKVLLEAELLDLKANPNRNAVGTVIEARLDKGRGNVATVLVQNGTLHVGDTFVVGIYSGRVRALFDERERRVEEVGPSRPGLVLGLDGAPEVGDQFVVLDDEREARAIAQKRQQIYREQSLRQRKHITLDEIGRRLALGDFKELNLIVKGDVGGSVEALSDALLKLSTEEVKVNIIHSGVGAITESDVMLASASDAVIVGFQVRPMPSARALAEREEIDIRLYSIIYTAIEEIRDALEGLLSPEKSEVITGVAEVRETFKVPKAGMVAGCYVSEGKIRRSDRIRLIRDGIVIYEGNLSSLRRFKDDVREVTSGYECGMSIENYNDIKVGDQIEAFEIVETKRKLEV
ncbi:translation initiation factor IF-2 [Rhodocaloribacter sp.]